jgi:hypothetical protein
MYQIGIKYYILGKLIEYDILLHNIIPNVIYKKLYLAKVQKSIIQL